MDKQSMGQGQQTRRKQVQASSGTERNWGELAVGVLVAAGGVYLALQGLKDSSRRTAARPARPAPRAGGGVSVEESITINKPVAELYRYWRNLENLPRIMQHLERVTDLGGGRSLWVAKGPVGTSIEWHAEIVEDVTNSRIVWRSVGDALVPNEGSVTFNRAPLGQGSEVHVSLTYHPPLGHTGALVARLFREEPSEQISADLKRYKRFLESGKPLPAWAATA